MLPVQNSIPSKRGGVTLRRFLHARSLNPAPVARPWSHLTLTFQVSPLRHMAQMFLGTDFVNQQCNVAASQVMRKMQSASEIVARNPSHFSNFGKKRPGSYPKFPVKHKIDDKTGRFHKLEYFATTILLCTPSPFKVGNSVQSTIAKLQLRISTNSLIHV